jgi:hypothetical protein
MNVMDSVASVRVCNRWRGIYPHVGGRRANIVEMTIILAAVRAFGSYEITSRSNKAFSQLSLFFIFVPLWTRTLIGTLERQEERKRIKCPHLAGWPA